VPPKYRLNLPHFLRVVLAVPLHLPGDAPGADGATAYRQRLADDLLDPARTVTAALRLEALADDRSVAALKAGLKSKDVKVRFCSAESLAYLGNSAGGEELATIVQEQPYLRAFALTALASLDQKVSFAKLQDILATSNNDVVRYGAFRALRTLNDKDEAIAGELLNESFWLHRVAPKTEPMIHVSSTKRPEIVLFGEEAKMEGPTENDQDHCMVSWVPPAGGSPERRECPLQAEAVLRTLAAMGVTYPEAIEILQQADQSKCLNCRVRADALPQLISVEELAEAGKKKADGTMEGVDILQTSEEIGATPGLFDNQRPRRANPFGEAPSLQQEAKPNRVIGGD
jgi:HEAT repeat protein